MSENPMMALSGVPQFMAHIGQELRLGAVRQFRPLQGRFQLLERLLGNDRLFPRRRQGAFRHGDLLPQARLGRLKLGNGAPQDPERKKMDRDIGAETEDETDEAQDSQPSRGTDRG